MDKIIICWLALEAVSLLASQAIQITNLLAGRKWRSDRLYIAPALVAAIIGAVQLGIGVAQKMKAAKLAKANKRPALEDNPYVQEAYDLTGSRAQEGLDETSMQAFTTGNDRNLASSINAILKGGGSSNNIASLYEGSQSGIRSLALANEEAKSRNVTQFLTAGLGQKADENRDQWYLNKYTPFQDMAAYSANLSAQGMDNAWKGVNTLGGAAGSYLEDKTPARQTSNTSNNLRSSTVTSRAAPNTSLIPLPGKPSVGMKRFDAVRGVWIDIN